MVINKSKAKLRKVLSFYEVPSMSHLLWSKSLFLLLKILELVHNTVSVPVWIFSLQELYQMTQCLIFFYVSCIKRNSSSKVWSPYKCGSIWLIFIIWDLTTFGNPFHKTSRNKIFPYFAESERMTFLHAIKACNNRLFRLNNQLFYWLFWKLILLVLWIKT